MVQRTHTHLSTRITMCTQSRIEDIRMNEERKSSRRVTLYTVDAYKRNVNNINARREPCNVTLTTVYGSSFTELAISRSLLKCMPAIASMAEGVPKGRTSASLFVIGSNKKFFLSCFFFLPTRYRLPSLLFSSFFPIFFLYSR